MTLRATSWAALALIASSACGVAQAQDWTVKFGAGYIDPRATSSTLHGTIPIEHYPGHATDLPGVNRLTVQPQGTVLFSIARKLDDNWDAELVLGVPPKHDVKFQVGTTVKNLAKITPTDTATYLTQQTAARVAAQDGQVVATVKQVAPTFFINYKFGDATSKWRPYVGGGINVTMFDADATSAGAKVYNDGKVRIKTTTSFGLAFQTGMIYKIDDHWQASVGWYTAAVRNDITIKTDNSEQKAFYRFHPSVFSAMVGYTF